MKRAVKSPERHAVDVYAGNRLRLLRTLRGMSQEELGQAIELTFQQVQKYEKGANRMSAGMLWKLGQILGVNISFFFEGRDDAPQGEAPRLALVDDKALMRRESLELMRAWYAITDTRMRSRLFDVIKGCAAPHD